MILRTILFAFVLFIAYNFFIAFAEPEAGKGQHQWQKNTIEAQEYIYTKQGTEVVMVGSSLSFRINNNMLPQDIYNLSLAGGSVYTGLEIIKRCPRKPKKILIETNFLIRPGDENMINELFRPVVWKVKNAIPALQEKFQPVNVLMPFVNNKILAKAPKKTVNESVADSTIVNKLLNNYIADHQKLPDYELLNQNFAQLKEYLQYFKKQGIEIYFYQLPVHCKLEKTPYSQALEKFTLQELPKQKYSWFPESNCEEYFYSDGEHLTYASATKFAQKVISIFKK